MTYIMMMTKRVVFSIKGGGGFEQNRASVSLPRGRGDKSCKITLIDHISSNCHQKYFSNGQIFSIFFIIVANKKVLEGLVEEKKTKKGTESGIRSGSWT